MNELGFIKNRKILEENYREDDLINALDEQIKFFSLVQQIEESSLVGLVGPYGEGKSTYLNQLKKLPLSIYGPGGVKWFEFDAWKYPERGNLWENFTLEIARQVDEKKFEDALKKIEGRQKEDKKTFINTIGDIPGMAVIKNFNHFLHTSPAKRTFEIQKILLEQFTNIPEKKLFIIIEDIDRSGDSGIYFLETLSHFLKNEKIDKKIICIIPIGTDSYMRSEVQSSYMKTLDFVQEFNLRKIGLGKFVDAVFDDKILSNNYHKGQITTFLESLFKEFPGQMNMRKLKMILRNANQSYINLYKQHGEGIDWRLSILFETSKYIRDNSKNIFYIDSWRKNNYIVSNLDPFVSLINCVIQEGKHIGSRRLKHKDYDNVYKKENTSNGESIRMLGLDYNFSIRFEDFNYKTSTSHDSVLLNWNDYEPDGSRNYFMIIKDYLF